MSFRDDCVQTARWLKARAGIEAPDENIIATVHLMNRHGLDQNAALDQSSRTPHDHGIDAWHFDASDGELFIYQSKLSESRAIVAKGFGDLHRAHDWLEAVVIEGSLEEVPSSNHSLFNLYTRLSQHREALSAIHFTILSPLDRNEVEELEEHDTFNRILARSQLNARVRKKPHGRLTLSATRYDLQRSVPAGLRLYSVERIPHTRIQLRPTAYLELAYLSLSSLVQLHRERGDVLFDKNVRLSLHTNKEARDRLVNPMETTLGDIVAGRLTPSIFAFYHIGVTLSASASEGAGDSLINLEAPSIINGCQTIVIADEYLKKLERLKAEADIVVFKQIKVIAKVVVGTTSDELKEITNANNRQNPIENWQLFSNESVHIEIENALKDIGVFYERQKGKFEAVMKKAETAKHFSETNGTFVKVVDLAQIVSLCRQNTQLGAKPSDVFVTKESHDKCFDKYVPSSPRDVVFAWNLYKALRRGLNTYLEIPAQVNSNAPAIFKKPIVRAHVYALGLLYFYQSPKYAGIREQFSRSLNKKANPRLVEEAHSFFQRVVTKTRRWYSEESKELTVDISKKRLDAFFTNLAGELGIDDDGDRPFTSRAIDWRAYST
jgi:hypothetical protein